jgi:AcrR family transcriptional regulator
VKTSLRERQAEMTRRLIVDAARRLFAKKGYVQTSMDDIAREAGVSIQTIYANAGGKPALAMALVDVADRDANVAELVRRIGQARDAAEVVRLAAALRRAFMDKASDIVRTLVSAAASDEAVAHAWREGQKRSRRSVEGLVRKLSSLGALREGLDVDEASDILYALFTPAVYVRLTEECGWSADRYEAWLADTIRRVLTSPSASRR